jgi:hypothetical protein
VTAQPTRSLLIAATVAALPALSAATVAAPVEPVSLAQQPVVMRLGKDEFRIAFGLNAATRCATSAQGCSGVIRYRVDWKTEDGALRSEIKRVNYSVAPQSQRGLAVDRQYFDTAEGAHTTDVVKVSVDQITTF